MEKNSQKANNSIQIPIKNILNPFAADYLTIVGNDAITIILDKPTDSPEDNGTISGQIDGGLDLKWNEVTLTEVWIQCKKNKDSEEAVQITQLAGKLSIAGKQFQFAPCSIELLDFFHFSAPSGFGLDNIGALQQLVGNSQSFRWLENLEWFTRTEDFGFDLVLKTRNGQLLVDMFIQTKGETRQFKAFDLELKEELIGLNISRTVENNTMASISWGVLSIGEVEIEHSNTHSTLGCRLQLNEQDVSLNLDIAANSQLSLGNLLTRFGFAQEDQWTGLLAHFPFLNNIRFEALNVRCNKGLNQIIDASIRGLMLMNDDVLEVRFDFPLMEISLNYISGTGMDAAKLIQLSNNDLQLFHGTATISRLGVICGLTTGDFAGGIGLATDWSFRLGRTPIRIREIDFNVTKSSDDVEFLASAVMTLGELDVQLVASKSFSDNHSGWAFSTEIAHDHPVELRQVIMDLSELFHFPMPDFIPALSVSRLHMSFNTETHDFGLSLIIQLQKPGLGPFTEGDLFIEINLTKNANGSHDFEMNLSGFITVAGTEFDASVQNIGRPNWAIDLVWDKQGTEGIDLTKIMQFFEGEGFQPHGDFHKLNNDLLIEHAEFHYQHGDESTSTDTSFLIDLKLRVGDNEFEGFLSGLKKMDGGSWHFLFGVGYDHLNSIPNSVFDSSKMTDFTVENIWLAVNTSTETVDNWPPLPATIPAVITQQGLKAGLVFLAEMDISQQKAIPGASDVFATHEHTKVVVLAEIGTSGLLLEAILEGNLQIPTGKGHHLEMEEVSLSINLGTAVSLQLKGSFNLDIDDHQQHITVSLDVDESGIVLTADDKIDNSGRKANTKGWHPFGLKGLNIDELAFELGIDFLPPGVRVGFEGKMHLDGEKPGDDMIAIVLEFSEPIPNPEYLAIAFDQLKFSQIGALFPGSSSEGHQHISDNLLEIDRFGLVWCEKPIVLPDGTNARIGFSLHGAVKILNWGAYFSLEVHPDTGIQGDGEMAPIHIGPLRITGKGTGVGIKQELVDGKWRDVSNVIVNPKKDSTKLLKTNETRVYELVKPGGVSIQFNSATSPYLRMSADVQLFGMDLLDIDIDIEKDSAIFDLFFQIPLVAKFKVASYLKKNHDFGFKGNFFLGLDIDIHIPFFFKPIHIHVRIGFDVGMSIEKTGDHMNLELKGSFMLMGKEISLGDLKIEGVPTSLKELPKWILDRIEGKPVPHFSNNMVDGSGGNNQDDYSQQREQLANDLLEKAERWANFVHEDIEQLKREGVLSDDQMRKLAGKIDTDTKAINTEGGQHTKDIQKAGITEVSHLKALADLAKKQPKDSNKWRAEEINRMKWEMRWLKDESDELRDKLRGIWEEVNGDEAKITEKTEKLIAKDSSSTTGYPRRAVEHHLKILTIHQRSHSLEHEVLQRGRTHAQAILNNVNQKRFYPLEKLKVR